MQKQKPQSGVTRRLRDRFARLARLAKAVVWRPWGLGMRRLAATRNPVLGWAFSRTAMVRRLLLRRMTIVGITGSCGKTTTTLLTGAVLSSLGRCRVKGGIAVRHTAAETLLSVASSTRFFVHEIGAFELGSVARAVRILRPQIGIVTVVRKN